MAIGFTEVNCEVDRNAHDYDLYPVLSIAVTRFVRDPV